MFIELNRTFHELSESADDHAADTQLFLSSGENFNWSELLQEYRVVILSEAGSGKTEEIRHIAQYLRNEGKAAFFIRLEHISQDFESSFEEGTYEEFESWKTSDNEGWILLDSVDEARLREPTDFELAIRKFGRCVSPAQQRVHIVITGRTSAWRPKTDLAHCEKHLPYVKPIVSTYNDGDANDAQELRTKVLRAEDVVGFKIVALDDLSSSQVEKFAQAKGVERIKGFLDAVERVDAWLFTTRPLDLKELLEFWSDHGRIGTRFELMKNSIERRLRESCEDRAEVRPLSMDRSHKGAMLVAAASILTNEPTIQVPDGLQTSKGLQIKSLLTDWNDIECATLLSRPIFDEAIYGTVRFHHRSVREYLAAEWFALLLSKKTSRRNIEAIFFRDQYGVEVLVPRMRSLLPWLAIFDEKIRSRVSRLAPEVLFEGGDPSKLPLETRKQILSDLCEQLENGDSIRSIQDIAAIQRFSNPDLTTDIKKLISKFPNNDNVLWFLLRMVWQGELIDALPEAKGIAATFSAGEYVRIAAIRAVFSLGSNKDKAELRVQFQNESGKLSRKLLEEMLDRTDPSVDTINWLFECIKKLDDKKRYEIDGLSDNFCSFIERTSLSWLPLIIENGNALLEEPPVIERRHCEISSKYSWLITPIAFAIERLVKIRDSNALRPACLSVLRKIPFLSICDLIDATSTKVELKSHVTQWWELNIALFWHMVECERAWLDNKNSMRLTDWWNVGIGASYINFSAENFGVVLSEISNRSFLDDRLIALSLAFKLYIDAGRPPKLRNQLRSVARVESVLNDRLTELMHPPKLSTEAKKWKEQEVRWARRSQRAREREVLNNENWKIYLSNNIEKLRVSGLKEDVVSHAQYYLYNRMREKKNISNESSHGNWLTLEDEFGSYVARAFRDGVVAYWRGNTPQLRSEGVATNTIKVSTMFGLTGLAIEASETPHWPDNLDEKEAELTFRYAMHELNGFPSWLPRVLKKFPEVISRMSLVEIKYELAIEDQEKDNVYLLYDISFSGDWLWDLIAPSLLEIIFKSEPKNIRNLEYILKILQGSSVSNEKILQLVSLKTKVVEQPNHRAYWYAAWTGIEPDTAISSLEAYLNSLATDEDRTLVAMIYIIQLLGGRHSGGSRVREAYRVPIYLKRLYLLMHRYIRRNEDIQRENMGVYSPGLRDDAQDARDRLFGLLKEIPGKDAFLAIQEIAQVHPDVQARPWFRFHAKAKAVSDADSVSWTSSQVRELYESLELTPSCHRDLFDLAVLRLYDLKDDLENGDSSIASTLKLIDQEVEMRKYIGGWCRDCAKGRYSIPQEEELADAKRPDFRWHGVGFDAPVPMELKLAEKWTGPQLFERLNTQLCGNYLRDIRSSRGIFVLFYSGKQKTWQLPTDDSYVSFDELILALQRYWEAISYSYPKIDEIRVIGIDLTKRTAQKKNSTLIRKTLSL